MAKRQYTVSYLKENRHVNNSELRTLVDCLKYYAEKLNVADAVVFASSDGISERHCVSWQDLYNKSVLAAKSLINIGVRKGEVVAINIRPCPEWLYLAFGAILAGAQVIGISFTYTDGSDLIEMMAKLRFCSVLALDPGIDDKNWAIVEKLVHLTQNGGVVSDKMPYLRYLFGHHFDKTIYGLRQVQSLLQLADDDVNLPDLDENDIVALFQTSGSTGIPKLVAHTHTSLMSVRHLTSLDYFSPKSRLYTNRPFNWIGGFPLGLLNGQTRVTVYGFGKPPLDKAIREKEIITEENCICIVCLPPRLATLIGEESKLPANWPVKTVVTGSQPLMKTVTKAIGTVCKKIECSYPSTEALYVACNEVSNSEDFNDFSCGRLVSNSGTELTIVGEDGKTLPVNTRGELYIKGPGIFTGYYNDPDKTSSVFTEDGWYKSDDIGKITENGEVYVEGRRSNIIISGGMNIAPELMETVLQTCPGVQSVVIVPVSDVVYHQVLCACIVPTKDTGFNEERLRQFCRGVYNDKAGLFTVLPKFYLILDKFPETTTGKTSRKDLERVANQRLCKTR